MSETNSPLRAKRRMPFEERPAQAGRRAGAALVYLLLVVAFAGVAAYMALIERRPLESGWVIAPAVGAVWFALRAFMQISATHRL